MPKTLVRLDGRLLVERERADTLDSGGCAPMVVVLGAAAERVRAEARLAHPTVEASPDALAMVGYGPSHPCP
jgi:nicotine blue oxidoreductase